MELALQYQYNEYIRYMVSCHNPCFYGISFAIMTLFICLLVVLSHNPCFYGISFAIAEVENSLIEAEESQSLFLWN